MFFSENMCYILRNQNAYGISVKQIKSVCLKSLCSGAVDTQFTGSYDYSEPQNYSLFGEGWNLAPEMSG